MLTRVIGTVVVILVLYFVISEPVSAAGMTRNGVSSLGDAGTQVTRFLSNVVNGADRSSGTSSSRISQIDGTPRGGSEAGDGSYPIP